MVRSWVKVTAPAAAPFGLRTCFRRVQATSAPSEPRALEKCAASSAASRTVRGSGAAPGSGTITCDQYGDCAGATTVGIYKAPDFPAIKANAKPVFSETKTLAEVSG